MPTPESINEYGPVYYAKDLEIKQVPKGTMGLAISNDKKAAETWFYSYGNSLPTTRHQLTKTKHHNNWCLVPKMGENDFGEIAP